MIDIFLDNTLKFELEGSKTIVKEFGFFKALYIEYKPIFPPMSQKIKFSFFSKLSIHSSVSGSLVKYSSTLKLVIRLVTKKEISLSKILIDLYDLSLIKS